MTAAAAASRRRHARGWRDPHPVKEAPAVTGFAGFAFFVTFLTLGFGFAFFLTVFCVPRTSPATTLATTRLVAVA